MIQIKVTCAKCGDFRTLAYNPARYVARTMMELGWAMQSHESVNAPDLCPKCSEAADFVPPKTKLEKM